MSEFDQYIHQRDAGKNRKLANDGTSILGTLLFGIIANDSAYEVANGCAYYYDGENEGCAFLGSANVIFSL